MSDPKARVFYADEGFQAGVNDASGSTEYLVPDDKGQIRTSNPLWIDQLERLEVLGLVSSKPPVSRKD